MAVIAPDLSWDDVVAEGQRLVEEMNTTDDRVQWRLGELADLVEPEGGKPKYGDHTLSKFATLIGRAHCTVRRYRSVFRAWKDILPKRAPGPLLPYSVLRELAALDNRESLIEKMPAMTKSQAVDLRKAYQNPDSDTKEMDRWWKDLIKRANKDRGDEKYLDVDRHILLKVVRPSMLNTLRKGGEARIWVVEGLEKLFDDTVA